MSNLPFPYEIQKKTVLTHRTVKERVASTLVHPTPSGPFILAGDAAHVHSVNGGQGMNTGLADAFNLIWRLHFLLHHDSLPAPTTQALLSSYDTERRETAKGVIDVAAQLVRSTLSDAKAYVGLIEKNAAFITGMGVQYADVASPLVRASSHAAGLWTAGHRAPDLWLARRSPAAAADAVRLYQLLTYGRYLVVLAGAAATHVEVQDPRFATLVRVTALKARGVGALRRDGGDGVEEEQVHPDALGCSWVGKGDEYAVLVRPDCYVEFVGAVEDVLAYTRERLPGLFR